MGSKLLTIKGICHALSWALGHSPRSLQAVSRVRIAVDSTTDLFLVLRIHVQLKIVTAYALLHIVQREMMLW